MNLQDKFCNWLKNNYQTSYRNYLGGNKMSISTINDRLEEIKKYFSKNIFDIANFTGNTKQEIINNIEQFIKNEGDYNKNPSFKAYSYDKHSHGIPKAIIGSNNYGAFLKQTNFMIDGTIVNNDFDTFFDDLASDTIEETKPTNYQLNQILFGPPGTGKTFHTINKAVEIADNNFYNQNKENREELKRRFKELKESNQVVFTTFHQSMSYEEFLESLKPFEENKQVYYKIENGIFKQICEKADENPTENFVLIIDEINRGNIASIFGELITLIEPDKRKGEDEELYVKLPYSKQDFTVPKNLYINGTMNTADRSVEALDSALRRRFVFTEMPPDKTLLNEDFFEINLQEVLSKINLRIEKLIDKDHKIGHSYFMNLKSEIDLQNAFKNKIIPLLEEYFYGDFAKIGLVLGVDFISKNNIEENIFKSIDDIENYTDFENRIIYKTNVPKNIDKFINAVKNIYS